MARRYKTAQLWLPDLDTANVQKSLRKKPPRREENIWSKILGTAKRHIRSRPLGPIAKAKQMKRGGIREERLKMMRRIDRKGETQRKIYGKTSRKSEKEDVAATVERMQQWLEEWERRRSRKFPSGRPTDRT